MLVRDYMTRDVVTIEPDARLSEALTLMRARHVHRLPVVEGGALVGMVSEKDLLYATPPHGQPMSWVEASANAAAMNVASVMHSDVVTVCADCPIEVAAAIMADHDIGALPVMEKPGAKTIAGIITETDIFRLFVTMLGSRAPGVRASLEINNRKGALASLFNRIVEAGGSVVTVSSFPATSPARIRIVLKVADVSQEALRALLKPEETVFDLRDVVPEQHGTTPAPA